MRLQGDPDEPYTAGFACAKVNRDMEMVHSPDRLRTPAAPHRARRAAGSSTPITWDAALDEITARWKAIIAESGPEAILGYAYSRASGAHEPAAGRRGCSMRWARRRLQAGTVCDTCCETAWDMTCGPVGGTDPESVVAFRPGDRLGLRPDGGERPFLGAAGEGAEVRREAGGDRPAAQPDRGAGRLAPARSASARMRRWPAGSRISCCATGCCDRDYIAAHTLGFERWATRGAAEFPAGSRGVDHRAVGGRCRTPGGDVRRGEGVADPAGRGHDAAGAGRPGAARGGDAAGADRRLWAGRGRGAAAGRRVDGFPVRRAGQARPAPPRRGW